MDRDDIVQIKRYLLKGTNIPEKLVLSGRDYIKEKKTLIQKQGIVLAELCNALELKSIDISNADYTDVTYLNDTSIDIYRNVKTEVEVVFWCENYDVVVEMSR